MSWQIERIETRYTVRFRLLFAGDVVLTTELIPRVDDVRADRCENELRRIVGDLAELASLTSEGLATRRAVRCG